MSAERLENRAASGPVGCSVLLGRLKAIATELYQYAYGRDPASGDRYPAWEEIAMAYAALYRASVEISRLDFHAHLDVCEQCRENPMQLCLVGAELLVACGA